MNRLLARQLELNAGSREAWSTYASHRRHVMWHLLQCPSGVRLGIWGAGNANDLDLPHLAAHFREVHLVDCDADALARGLDQQKPDRAIVQASGDVDLSGVADRLAAIEPGSDFEIDSLLEQIQSANVVVPGAPLDACASICLLSQVIDSARLALGAEHPRMPEVAEALANRHLRLLIESVVPGGVGLLITDFASSTAAPGLAGVSDADLPRFAEQLISSGNFFAGLNPLRLQAQLRQPPFDRLVSAAGLAPPWRWQLADRMYAVTALRFHRAVDDDTTG